MHQSHTRQTLNISASAQHTRHSPKDALCKCVNEAHMLFMAHLLAKKDLNLATHISVSASLFVASLITCRVLASMTENTYLTGVFLGRGEVREWAVRNRAQAFTDWSQAQVQGCYVELRALTCSYRLASPRPFELP